MRSAGQRWAKIGGRFWELISTRRDSVSRVGTKQVGSLVFPMEREDYEGLQCESQEEARDTYDDLQDFRNAEIQQLNAEGF